MSQIYETAKELEAAGVEYEIDDRTDGISNPNNSYIRLKDGMGDTGAVYPDFLQRYIYAQSLLHLDRSSTHIIEITPTSEGEGYFDRWTVCSSAIEANMTTMRLT